MAVRQYLQQLCLIVAMGIAMLAAAPAAAVEANNGYVLGPDDAVQVIVYGQTEFNVSTRIKSDGTIVMPLIGVVKAAGETNITLAKLIGDRLTKAGFLKDPIINVEIGSYVSKSVNVAGKVANPGIVPLDRGYRALEVLLKTGWVRENGANYVYLRRDGAAEQKLDVEKLVRGDVDGNPVLRPGDTLFVPDAENFFIYGQINRSGSFAVLPGMTIRQALAVAGGVTASGSSNKVGIIRGNAKEVDADLAQIVQKNDVIIVKERLF